MDKKIILVLFILCGCKREAVANCEIEYDNFNLKINISALNNQITEVKTITRINGDIFFNDPKGFEYYYSLYKENYGDVTVENKDIIVTERFNMSDPKDVSRISDYVLKDNEYFSFNDSIESLGDDGFICVKNMLK